MSRKANRLRARVAVESAQRMRADRQRTAAQERAAELQAKLRKCLNDILPLCQSPVAFVQRAWASAPDCFCVAVELPARPVCRRLMVSRIDAVSAKYLRDLAAMVGHEFGAMVEQEIVKSVIPKLIGQPATR